MAQLDKRNKITTSREGKKRIRNILRSEKNIMKSYLSFILDSARISINSKKPFQEEPAKVTST